MARAKGKSVAAHCVRMMQRDRVHEIGVVCDFPHRTWFHKEPLAQRRTAAQQGTKKRENYRELMAKEEEYFGLAWSAGDYDWEDALGWGEGRTSVADDRYFEDEETAQADSEIRKATKWTMEELIMLSANQTKKSNGKLLTKLPLVGVTF